MQGMATSSHMYSKSEEKGLVFSISEDFLFCNFVLTCLIKDCTSERLSVSLGSNELSIFLYRARVPKRPKVDMVVAIDVLSNFILVNSVRKKVPCGACVFHSSPAIPS